MPSTQWMREKKTKAAIKPTKPATIKDWLGLALPVLRASRDHMKAALPTPNAKELRRDTIMLKSLSERQTSRQGSKSSVIGVS